MLQPAILPLLREIGDLKRIRSAGRRGSIADRLFARGWGLLIEGQPIDRVALTMTADALAATRLGDLDIEKLSELGLSVDRIRAILRAAIAELAHALDPALVSDLMAAVGALPRHTKPPAFVAQLAEQPRAGVTCPGKPRLMLQPPENHAEHSIVVAVYAVLLAPAYGAPIEQAFLAGMAHHLHSAAMPDSGYAGEILLGEDLIPAVDRARAKAMAELPKTLHPNIKAVLAIIADDESPAARAFHAADAIDRVVEIEQHLRAATATMDMVLGDYALVHDGPVKPFHDRVLAELGLA